MSSAELRKRFLEFFEKRGHKVIPSSSLIPDDPSVLLTTAGMQQFKKYYTDPSLAPAPNVASIQKCFRTSDIDEVGDESHLTFFEMLGNFSFGGYFKEEAITYAHEFITKELNLKIDYVTVFGGGAARIIQNNVPYSWGHDKESNEIWRKIDPKIRIELRGKKDNFWGPTGSEGPCGPTTEIYVNDTEIWNIVFNQYYQHSNGALKPLRTLGIDTGMGLERLAMVLQKKKNIFETDLFEPITKVIEINKAKYKPEYSTDAMKRVIADHVRACTFLIADGIRPSNKGAGYILRRLLRRIIVAGGNDTELAGIVIDNYGSFYDGLRKNREEILTVFVDEYFKFVDALGKGLKEFKKMEQLDAKSAFDLYQSFGIPYEVIKDYHGGVKAKYLKREDFDKEFKKHQKISRAGVEKKFGGHGLLLDTGELKAKDEAELKKVTRLHTATHLLQAALRKILGEEVKQMGSDITVERTRFDFSFPRKLTSEEIKKVEEAVNSAISERMEVKMQEMDIEDAKKSGALYFFKEKYPSRVKVYSAGDFSRELCGGPHVKNTGEIGRFKILKQEAVGAGLRRIRATVE